MKRFHLFEFHDWRWFPWRGYLTDLLTYQIVADAFYAPVYPLLKQALAATGYTHIVDMGSGSGGALGQLADWLSAHNYPVTVTLTDLFPPSNPSIAAPLSYHPFAVDARHVPDDLTGFRTFFTVFHHFRSADATAILQDAVDKGSPIAIFDFTERRWSNLLGMLLSPIAVWLQTWQIQPRQPGRLFWTYIIPIVPFIYWWDGTVSHLRTYTPDELRAMTDSTGSAYHWNIGKLATESGNITYLLGWQMSH